MNAKDKQVLRRALTRAAEHLQKQVAAAKAKIGDLEDSAKLYQAELDGYVAKLKALGDEA